jgi:endonuclease-3
LKGLVVRRLLTPSERHAFFECLSRQNPDPKTELFYTNPYTLLVAVVLSAQATDKGVNKVTPSLFALADTPAKMVALGEEGVRTKISSIGLYPTKARHIIALSHRLLEHYGGEVPGRRKDLETLPGVGRKTANVVLNVAFGHGTIPVDTHVFRVANRTGLAQGNTPLAVEKQLELYVSEAFRLEAHHLLILHGRYVCRAQKPLCATCVVTHLCQYPEKSLL